MTYLPYQLAGQILSINIINSIVREAFTQSPRIVGESQSAWTSAPLRQRGATPRSKA